MRIFKISFVNQGQIYELYAENVRQGSLLGFVEVEGLLFGETSSVVIDPGEEKLRGEFEGVNRTLVPMHAVIRIDEVEKRGPSKIFDLDEKTNVTPFPAPFLTPDKKPK